MKGIVFTEFLEMVEDRFGPDVVDRVVESSALPNGGAYTTVGTYDHREILRMVGKLSQAVQVDGPALVRAFGEHLAQTFSRSYPQFFAGMTSTFEFLPRVENYIHVEVRKLYPDAELPKFECTAVSPDCLHMDYRSARPFADLAEGLIAGTAKHFGERLDLARQDLPVPSGFGARFIITKLS